MKLAEALLIRSGMQKKLAQLKGRIKANVSLGYSTKNGSYCIYTGLAKQ